MDEVQNTTERIVLFLDESGNRAWKAATIADRLDLDADAVSTILSRLKERDLVRHKGSYWTTTDDEERLQAAYRLHRHHKNADGQYGEERFGEIHTKDMEEIS